MGRDIFKLVFLSCAAILTLPVTAVSQVTVKQLEQKFEGAYGKSDKEVADILAKLPLVQRLSNSRFEHLNTASPGAKSRLALLAIADASAFLDLPAEDLLSDPAPNSATQREILSRAVDFVGTTVSKMPNFFARRTTTRLQDIGDDYLRDSSVIITGKKFRLVERKHVTVGYREGQEVLTKNQTDENSERESLTSGLGNWGEFGPLLGLVLVDILRSKTAWSHWENGVSGPLAVFAYTVPQDRSNYTVRYCCSQVSEKETRAYEIVPAYHGEIAVDPRTGYVARLVVKADLQLNLPIFTIEELVEYGPVEIGGRTYICPRRSVTVCVTTASSSYRHIAHEDLTVPQLLNGSKKTAINDVVFNDYHIFRTEMRILPANRPE